MDLNEALDDLLHNPNIPDIPNSALESALSDFYVNMLPDEAFFHFQDGGGNQSEGTSTAPMHGGENPSQAGAFGQDVQALAEGGLSAPVKRPAEVAEGTSRTAPKRQPHGVQWQPGVPPSRQVAEFATARHLRESKPATDGALAQRRYAAKQKAKRESAQKELEDLTARMAELMNEKQELEVRSKVLEKELLTWQTHVEEMFANAELHLVQQMKMIESIAQLMTAVLDRTVSKQEASKWTLHDWINIYWQLFMSKMTALFQAAQIVPGGMAEQQLGELQAEAQKLGGLNSGFQTGLLAWNIEETNNATHQPPTVELWEATLTALRLSGQQETALLTAYKALLERISKEAVQRHDILARLETQAQSVPQEKLYCTPVAQELLQSFRMEQTAVLGFVFQADTALTNAQKAALSVIAHPWCPEILEICAVLARRRREEVPQIPEVGKLALEGSPLMPNYTAFGLLSLRVLGYGLGLRLRQAVLVCPFEPIMPRVGFPRPNQAGLSKMSVLDVHMGRWRQLSCWEWMGLVTSEHRLVHNTVTTG